MTNHAPTPLERAAVDAVLAPLAEARPFPGRAYGDDGVFAFERDRIFGRAWICIGRVNEVALPGQFLRETIAGEPIVVVRGADLELRALIDVCSHRGASVVGREPCGRIARFECPYHGWTYELDGRLAQAPHTPVRPHGLRAVRVDTWQGFVFVTLDADAAPLAVALGTVPPWLGDERIATVALGRRTEYEVAANWKLCVENFQESHHFPRVHRALERLTKTNAATSWLSDGPWLGGIMAIEGGDTVSLDGDRQGRPLIVPPDRDRTVFDAMLFPALLTSLQPDYLLTYRLTPLSAARTRVVADIYFHPAAVTEAFAPRAVYDFWDRVNAEDRAICEDQQNNTASRAFTPACYATVEEGMHAFDRMVAAVHREAYEP